MDILNVYIVKFKLTATNPTTPSQRYETALFVETRPDGSGYTHTVIGDASPKSPSGHRYNRKFQGHPEASKFFHSRTKVGVTPAASYPAAWDALLWYVPVSNRPVMRTITSAQSASPVCTSSICPAERGRIGSGEGYARVGDQMLVVGATQWTLEQAIPMLKAAGLLKEHFFR